MALTPKELKQLNAQMPPTCSVMASAVGKLLLTSPNPALKRNGSNNIFASFPHLNSHDWSDTGVVGALLLVIDRAQDAVMLQIWDLDGMLKRFEFEIYFDMDYMSLDPMFHAFEMEECVAGLSFSNREVARKFLAKVRALIPDSTALKSPPPGDSTKKNGGIGFFGSRVPKTPQVSSVITVTHHQHVGLRDDGTLDLATVSPEWRAIFKQAGVRKRDLKNPEVSRALIQSIQQSGYSLAVAPGVYVRPSPNKPKEGLMAERRIPAQQTQASRLQQTGPTGGAHRQTRVYTPQELQPHYTKEQVAAYAEYQRQLAEYEKAQKKYYEDLAEYERQMALLKWEKDNAAFLEEQERIKRASKDPRYMNPPPLPPRKKKTADVIGGSSSSVLDVRPRFETAPPGQSTTKSYASTKPPPITTQSLPTQPARKPLTSPLAASGAVKKPPVPPRTASPPSRDPEPVHFIDRPQSPEAPAPPQLPTLKNGDNPILGLQEQLQAVRLKPADRPESKMLLRAVAGSQLDLRDTMAPATRKDPARTEDILNTLINALAVRRAQLGEDDDDDDDDDWSD